MWSRFMQNSNLSDVYRIRQMKIRGTQLTGITLGSLTLMIHWFGPPEFVEVVHGRFLFPFFSLIFDHSVALLPFSVLYLMVPFLLGLALYLLRQWYRNFRLKRSGWGNLLLGCLAAAGFVLTAFYSFWGFNYDRIQMKDRLTWAVESIGPKEFMNEARSQVVILQEFTGDRRSGIGKSLAYNNYRLLEVAIRQEAVKLAELLGYLGRKRVRCRQLVPSGILLRFSTAGFYNPLSGECNIDKGLHPLQKPFSMAHEFFHGMGITGEGDCNFLAYLLCHQSDHEFIRYSGELGYWRYIQHALRYSGSEEYQQLVSSLPESVIRDMEDIDRQMDKYPDIAPRMRDAIYAAYLKSNKIHDGLANYNQILQLVINWRKNGEKL
jgi:hypothetical protein